MRQYVLTSVSRLTSVPLPQSETPDIRTQVQGEGVAIQMELSHVFIVGNVKWVQQNMRPWKAVVQFSAREAAKVKVASLRSSKLTSARFIQTLAMYTLKSLINEATSNSTPPISTILNPCDLGCQVATESVWSLTILPVHWIPPEGCPSKTSGGSVYKASPHIPAPS